MIEIGGESVIIEASPLISILKIERFDLFAVLPGCPVCTEYVCDDVREDAQKSRLNALLGCAMIREVKVIDLDQHTEINDLIKRGFGYGEASSIVLAHHMSIPLVMDDKRALRVAHRLQIRVLTTTDVVAENIRCGNITVQEADQLIADWVAAKDFPVTVRSFQELFPS